MPRLMLHVRNVTWKPSRLLTGLSIHAPLIKVASGVAGVVALGLYLASGTHAPPLAMEAPPNPPANINPVPNFLAANNGRIFDNGWVFDNPCITPQGTWPITSTDPACDNYVLSAINNARAQEHLAPMVLPSNWQSLTVAQQMFVVTNLERVARGYPPYLGLNESLDQAALVAALHRTDPNLAKGFAPGYNALGDIAWGGSWAEGFNVLSGMYLMMYSEGWGGSADATSNIVCTSPNAPGCWAHREELLGNAPHFDSGVGLWCNTCEFGAAYAIVDGTASYAQLIEMPLKSPPPVIFSWQSELTYFPSGAVGPVKTVTLARASLTRTAMRVRWAISGTQSSSLAVVYTFRGSTCANVNRAFMFRYIPAFNIQRSTVSLSGAGTSFPRGAYSAVVRVFAAQGSLTSRCVAMGRS